MKTIKMKNNLILLSTICLLMTVMISSCNSQTTNADNKASSEVQNTDNKTVTVYYFHGDRRCTTCKAVGKVSKETIDEAFQGNASVIFMDINIDEPENNEIKDRFELSGSGLFVYDGTKKIDLTAFAFQKAVDSPDELTKKLQATVEDLL